MHVLQIKFYVYSTFIIIPPSRSRKIANCQSRVRKVRVCWHCSQIKITMGFPFAIHLCWVPCTKGKPMVILICKQCQQILTFELCFGNYRLPLRNSVHFVESLHRRWCMHMNIVPFWLKFCPCLCSSCFFQIFPPFFSLPFSYFPPRWYWPYTFLEWGGGCLR